MARVSEELGTKASTRQIRKPDGKIGRIDSFLGRSVPHPDPSYREFLILELKRPSLKVGRKEIDQLEDYVNAIKTQPDFMHTSTYWNFYLITGEYEHGILDRITQKNRPPGLFIEKDNSKVWVKSWAEVVRECESRLRFVQERLRVEVSKQEIESRIAQIKASILRNALASSSKRPL